MLSLECLLILSYGECHLSNCFPSLRQIHQYCKTALLMVSMVFSTTTTHPQIPSPWSKGKTGKMAGEGVPSSSSTIEYHGDTFEGYKEWPAINQEDYNIQSPQIILPRGIPHSTFTFYFGCIFLLALLLVWVTEAHFCSNLQWPWSILPNKPHSSPMSTPPLVMLFPK